MNTHQEAVATALIAASGAADYAYQPIIHTSTLRVHGFEALARLPADSDAGICKLLDDAFAAGVLREVEKSLLATAITKFAGFEGAGAAKLFCNLDHRSFDGRIPSPDTIDALLNACGLPLDNLCLEISERAPIQSAPNLLSLVALLRSRNISIAIDDFGIGASGLHMLLTVEPNYVKIDQNFINGLAASPRKQAIVAKLCSLAHSLCFTTIAEGVESESDFRAARDLGCDFAQGYHIARPTLMLNELAMSYGRTITVEANDCVPADLISRLTPITPLYIDDSVRTAKDAFAASPGLRMIPVIDRAEEVQGAIYELDLRAYLSTEFGIALLANRGLQTTIASFVKPCPIADALSGSNVIIDRYVDAENSHGLILSVRNRYVGYLSNHAVLRMAAVHHISQAKDQNPLSGLPGNKAIGTHIDAILNHSGPRSMAHFDFNNFKVFNDNYGFNAGDQALLMFAGLLHRQQAGKNTFVGHIGGDDFFISIEGCEDSAEAMIIALCAAFAAIAKSLYSPADRARGGIEAADRFGIPHFFPLLSVSASILHLPQHRGHLEAKMVHLQLAAGKTTAKRAPSGIAIMRLPERADLRLDDCGVTSPAFINTRGKLQPGTGLPRRLRSAKLQSNGSPVAQW